MSHRSDPTVVWEATAPVPRWRAWGEATLALEYHYRRLATTIWKAYR